MLGLAFAGIVALAAFALFRTGDEATPLFADSEFPEWAVPRDAVELSNSESCSTTAVWWPPCRTIEFGTNRTIEDVVDELQTAFKARRWSAQIEPHDWSLHVLSRLEYKCIVFYPEPEEERRNAPRQEEFSLIIGVVLDQCGVR